MVKQTSDSGAQFTTKTKNMPKTTRRKLRTDAPPHVKAAVEKLEPYFTHADSRSVMRNKYDWAIHWYWVQLATVAIACIMDMFSDNRDYYSVKLEITPHGCRVSLIMKLHPAV